MNNIGQGNPCSPMSNPVGSRSRIPNMFFLQMKPNNSEVSLEGDPIPFHMVVNEQDPSNQQYFIPVVEGKQLQLLIDSHEQVGMSPANNQYYITTEPQPVNAEFQILNDNNSIIPGQENVMLNKMVLEARSDTLSCNKGKSNKSKVSLNGEQKKKTLQRFVHIADRAVPPRAVAVLPPALQLRRGAVAPRRALPARVRFGPVQGVTRTLSTEEIDSLKQEHTNSGTPLFLLKTEDGTYTHIDVSDEDKSNWISLLPLGEQNTANVWVYQEGQELFAATVKSIPARVPLMLGYSREYVDVHKLPEEKPILDLNEELTATRQWWCHECQRSMPTAALLQRHTDVCHSEEKPRSRRYRCLHCTRSFCRLFTLRRHTARHCTKKSKEEKNNESMTSNGILDPAKPDELPDLSINSSTAEDSRLPSDESLQTLTNNLDFSTNLFDTDRINLDISGSLRSEDFNPYSLGLKDDMTLAATVDFEIDETCGKKEIKKENTETVFLTCRYCNQAVIRGRQRQHVKSCTGRRFHCECGRAFLYKDKLALHIHAAHARDTPEQWQQKIAKEEELQYKCETCNHRFKRRGMLVNHLWRVHKTLSTALPLEKKVRHYPCIACPKVYRTAAKRDSHVKIHHPGHELSVGTSIEGGRVACAPAACAACPRQYATRAKLLQHVRLHHPALAPPVKKKMPLK